MSKNAFSISKRFIGPPILRRVEFNPKTPFSPELQSTQILPFPPAPIPIETFYKRLRTLLWGQSSSSEPARPVRLGLAISGGVDSMALADLVRRSLDSKTYKQDMSRRGRTSKPSRDSIRAFIVDHGLRKESALEAAWVRETLLSMGIVSQVVSPSRILNSNASNLETSARTARYQALGLACKEHNIDTLLFAHHQDDQAETVLMRLAQGHKSAGLRGIDEIADIPECHGMYGIDKSGAPQSLNTVHGPMEVEGGGIRILRPLLGFSKARLKATCLETGVKWAEDKTNQDRTLTTRNAIRHIFETYKLPAALSKPALLALAFRARTASRTRASLVERLHDACDIDLNDTSGVLHIRFDYGHPIHYHSEELSEADHSMSSVLSSDTLNRDNILVLQLLQRIASLVSPNVDIPLDSLATVANDVYSNTSGAHSGRMETSKAPGDKQGSFDTRKQVTAAGIVWKPIPGKVEEWTLVRQPYRMSQPEPRITIEGHIIKRPPSATKRTNRDVGLYASQWQLWDGRYWIRLLAPPSKSHAVLVRPLQPVHLKPFLESLSQSDRKKCEEALRTAAPGDVRWTLPSIVLHEDDHSMKEEKAKVKERVVALPSLGIGLERRDAKGVGWEIRYKKIVLPRSSREGSDNRGEVEEMTGGRQRPAGRLIIRRAMSEQRDSRSESVQRCIAMEQQRKASRIGKGGRKTGRRVRRRLVIGYFV